MPSLHLLSTICTTSTLGRARCITGPLWTTVDQLHPSIWPPALPWEFFAWTSFKNPAKGKHALGQIEQSKIQTGQLHKGGRFFWKCTAFWCFSSFCGVCVLISFLYIFYVFFEKSFLGKNCQREQELRDGKQFQFQSGWSRLPDKMGSLWQTSLGSFKAQQHSEVSKIQNTKENYILFPSIWIVLRPSSVMWHKQSDTLREDHHHSVLLAINGNKTKPVDLIRQD